MRVREGRKGGGKIRVREYDCVSVCVCVCVSVCVSVSNRYY